MGGSRTHTHSQRRRHTHKERGERDRQRQTEYAELKVIYKINDKVKELPFIV